ncbi:MAG: hypothetical protein ACP5D2_00165 [Candidatus Nanoarchaeia archaeon]
MIPHVIGNKSIYYQLYSQGVLGNRARAWDSLEQLQQSDWRGGVCIRDKRGTRRGNKTLLPVYNLPFDELTAFLRKLEDECIPLSVLKFNQALPDQHLQIQGEVMRNHKGLCLTYSDVPKPMKQALEEKTLYASGFTANQLLKHHLWPASYVDINQLLDYFHTQSSNPAFPSAVVEFSAYSVRVGNTRGRNTIIWEVRAY